MSTCKTSLDALLFRAKAEGRPVILDGATGTELDNRGVRLTPPIWSGLAPLRSETILFRIHEEYATAGAEILTACTFRTTQRTFAKAGMHGDEWQDAARSAVRLACKAASGNALVAGSIAPLEDCFVPSAATFGKGAMEEHLLLCEVLVDAGVDVLWLETFGTLGELEAAMNAAKQAGQGRVPIAVSVTTNASGNLISGEFIEGALQIAKNRSASAFLVNCIPVSHVEKALPLLKQHASMPIGAYANLGFAEPTQDWSGSAHLTPDEYAAVASSWQLDIVGGCCGSSPAHIQALATEKEKERRGT